MSFRCCTFSGRFIFMLNVVTILVLTLFYVALENKISILISKHEIAPLTESKDLSIGHHLGSSVVIYNRVPKTGSTSFVGLAYDLCSKNKYNVLHVNVSKNAHLMSLPDQMRFVLNVSQWDEKKPAFYHGHIAYVDFSKFGASSPMYINLLRQPLERLISYYYFLRFGDDFRPHLVRKKQGDKMTFDDCVKANRSECDPNNLWLQVPFFCGQHADCWLPGNPWALEEAKKNLVDNYLVVGVTEQMEEFVAVLEAALPRFFKGALKLYRQGSKSHLRKTNKKIAPRAETVAIFKNSSVWQLEDQFYQFALRQFESIKSRTLDIPSLSAKGQQFFYEKIRPK